MTPVFALRTEMDLGIGDTEGVRQLIDWCARHGLSLLQVLPINETSDDNSPYNAISSMALDPTTIAVSPRQVPDLSPAKFRALAPPDRLRELRQGPVDYPGVKALKQALLWEAFGAFHRRHWRRNTDRAQGFRRFLADNQDWISDYGLFRVLMEDYHNWPTWDRWPEDRQTPKRAWTWLLGLPEPERETVTRRVLFHSYVQWLAFDQWAAIKEYATRHQVSLMGDVPFGVCRYSADVWANRGIFDLDWNGGAPPEKVFASDLFTEKWGQNWGIPLYRWEVLRERNLDWWRTRIGNVQKVFHLFRIDHVLGFFRIYAFPWKPEENDRFLPLGEDEAGELTGGRRPGFKPYPDDSEAHQEFNRQQGEELLRLMLDAAGDMTVVGEDLGLVPEYVPPTLAKLGIPGFKIPNFLRAADGSFVAGADYPRRSLATLSTHDHPPIAAAWRELWERADAGEARAERELREWMSYCGQPDTDPPRLFAAVHELLLRSVLAANSWLAVFMITDLFGWKYRFNAPGDVAASNWSNRLETTVARLDRDPVLREKTAMVERLVRETGRAP